MANLGWWDHEDPHISQTSVPRAQHMDLGKSLQILACDDDAEGVKKHRSLPRECREKKTPRTLLFDEPNSFNQCPEAVAYPCLPEHPIKRPAAADSLISVPTTLGIDRCLSCRKLGMRILSNPGTKG